MIPRGQKGAKNPLVSAYVYTYIFTPLRFATISLGATKFETNARYRLEEAQQALLLVEIGTPDVDIYFKDFSFFFYFVKNGTNDFFLISVIKCHEFNSCV